MNKTYYIKVVYSNVYEVEAVSEAEAMETLKDGIDGGNKELPVKIISSEVDVRASKPVTTGQAFLFNKI